MVGDLSLRGRWASAISSPAGTFLRRRVLNLDGLAVALLAAGLLLWGTGALPSERAWEVGERIAPLLAFLLTAVVLAELAGRAQVFDVAATWVARLARGSYPLLFLWCVALASATTIALNLDTTAVLLTPVMLALASRVGIRPVPLAMTTVWLANTASLLLPVSNLTNLLAAQRVVLVPTEMAAVMWAPQLAAIVVTMACLWGFYWRRSARGDEVYVPPERPAAADPWLFGVCAAACGLFLLAIIGFDVALPAASAGAALLAAAAFFVRRRGELRWSLVPWRLLALVPGMFLVVDWISSLGLRDLLMSAVGSDGGFAGLLRTAAVGAGLSNVLNNLPAYLSTESVIPADAHTQLLALLIGVNVGPLVTPFASLATLIWFERCRAHGVRIAKLPFAGAGLVLASAGVVAATGALHLVA
ncbi:SLC13 family permease [Streptomyces niger]|uniref:SLC13 family permease n=1 Tax=Streptomyces niger TaxID=66373 RepID=UPI000A982B94|nr:SLC13 family permease [Streptomyces niger]